MMRLLEPEDYYVSVTDIEARELVSRGYRAVLLDFDNTLKPRGNDDVPSEVIEWIALLEQAGLRVAIITNTNNERVAKVSRQLGLVLVRNAFKPLSGAYVKACAFLGVSCRDAVMIGDQSYTDVLGAQAAGMDAILVVPQSSKDPFHTYLLRCIDRFSVRRMRAKGATR